MSSVAQMLRQAEALKSSVSDSSKTISETWSSRQRLEDIYKKVLLSDLEYALDKKVEQELWNYAFKNQINSLQSQAKDKQNVKRAEVQATLNLFLETASGFYLQFLQLLCTTFKLDLPFRRKSACYGVLKERTSSKLKVTPPKKSSCLYVCQHCLVHLGDIARYRQQIDQAQTYYWHAAYLVPFNGQPYNQLAILEASKGNKLSTVFYYIRSLAVKVPFSVAATNLEKLYAKLTKDIPDFKGRLSASEMITGFLQFHALVHLCTDLVKAREISDKLAGGLPSHVTSQSFPWQVLVQIVAINIFAMNHVQHIADGEGSSGMTNGESELTDDEETCFNLVFALTVRMLDILLQYTPKQEAKVCEYFTLPAVKLLLDWLRLNPHNFQRPVLKNSPLWGNLCTVLNCIQGQQAKWETDLTKFEDLPLPEDSELRCFQPIEKAHSGYSYSRLPADGLGFEIETQLRCHRLMEHGRWIMEEQTGVSLFIQTEKGVIKFTSPNTPVTVAKVAKSVTLSLPSNHTSEVRGILVTTASPERKSNRQNVAIQAIMQKQAQQDKGSGGSKVRSVRDEPNSPQYLLGVPTSEPVFFKSPGGRGGMPNQGSPQNPTASVVGAIGKIPVTGAHTGGVLVLKNNDHLAPSPKPSPQQSSKGWNQQRQGSMSWQQGKTTNEKAGWSNSQGQSSQGQEALWQPGQAAPQRPQTSPGVGQAQWQFPGQPNFSRQEFRPRMPMSGIMGPSTNQQASMFAGNSIRAPYNTPNTQPQENSENQPHPGSTQAPHQPFNQGSMTLGNLMMNRPPGTRMNNMGSPQQSPDSLFPPSRPIGPREGLRMPGQGAGLYGPGFPSMFNHPPPPNRFPMPNYGNPENQGTGSQPGSTQQVPQGPRGFGGPGFHGNSFAPGNDRPLSGRDGQPQTPPQVNFQQNPYMGPFSGFMGMPGNQLKSPLESLFGKPRFPTDDLPPNMADIVGSLSKMTVQPPRDSPMPPARSATVSFQGYHEGTQKPENYYQSNRSQADVHGNDSQGNMNHQQQQQQQQQGTYSLFSGSPWLSSGDSKSIGSSPFSSESSSIRNSPDPNSDNFNSDIKSNQVLDMGLRFGTLDERGKAPGEQSTGSAGPFFQNNVQSIWSNQAQSPLERLLELQKQQRHTDPH
ncbi:nonsense-mediated mRNA decay factor SMG7-like [Mya arenaria]|uniref:nonsense-mediated mRNA decay factor SMG7-like n=1 Tax=Mya arenaria TaxID=6604 RepID=UPI0022E7A718|nr:nonsense-mediated mRNA decay factor SMG7-like [Mya arenaria]